MNVYHVLTNCADGYAIYIRSLGFSAYVEKDVNGNDLLVTNYNVDGLSFRYLGRR